MELVGILAIVAAFIYATFQHCEAAPKPKVRKLNNETYWHLLQQS